MVDPIQRQQFIVSSTLGNRALVDHKDHVSAHDGGEQTGDVLVEQGVSVPISRGLRLYTLAVAGACEWEEDHVDDVELVVPPAISLFPN